MRYAATNRHKRNSMRQSRHVGLWQILLQKSPQSLCRIEMRNNRIEPKGFLNQYYALEPDLESILRAPMSKILLQHNRHQADVPEPPIYVRFSNRPIKVKRFQTIHH